MERRIAYMAGIVLWLAVAYMVGRDGSWGYQVLRVAVVTAVATGGVFIARHYGGRGAGLTAMVAGLVGVVAGVGIGVRYVVASAWSPVAFAGSAALVSGLVLLVIGGHSVLAGQRWWGKVLTVVGSFGLLCLALLTMGQALAATNVPLTAAGSTTPADHGLEFEDVHVTTSDGVPLAGWYIPGGNGAAVVLRHGAGSAAESLLAHAVVLARNGYGVLLLDARGHGRSGGRAMDFGWYGDQDIAAGVEYLWTRSDVRADGIGVLGLSMGGEEAIGAAAADARIRAVVAEGAEQRTAEDKAWLVAAHGTRGALQQRLDRITYTLTDLMTDAEPPIPLREAVGVAAPARVLLIAGAGTADELDAAEFIASGAPETVEVWVAAGGHASGLAEQPRVWEDHVIGFLDRWLLPGLARQFGSSPQAAGAAAH